MSWRRKRRFKSDVIASSRFLAIGKAEVVVVEFEPPAFLTAIEVERLDLFPKIGQLAQEEMPARIGPADADRELAEAAERDLAVWAVGRSERVHGVIAPCAFCARISEYRCRIEMHSAEDVRLKPDLHFDAAALTSTRLSKNVAPPPMSVRPTTSCR